MTKYKKVTLISYVEHVVSETLRELDAPLVTVHRPTLVLGNKWCSEVPEMRFSMGECTGAEFEKIKLMRQQVEMTHCINIINTIIDF